MLIYGLRYLTCLMKLNMEHVYYKHQVRLLGIALRISTHSHHSWPWARRSKGPPRKRQSAGMMPTRRFRRRVLSSNGVTQRFCRNTIFFTCNQHQIKPLNVIVQIGPNDYHIFYDSWYDCLQSFEFIFNYKVMPPNLNALTLGSSRKTDMVDKWSKLWNCWGTICFPTSGVCTDLPLCFHFWIAVMWGA